MSAVADLKPTKYVAKVLKCHRATVVRNAALEPVIGVRMGPHWWFSEADIEALKKRLHGVSGNPNWRSLSKAARAARAEAGRKGMAARWGKKAKNGSAGSV